MCKKRLNNNDGFTLTELLVVIAIIGILAAILVPALIAYVRDARLDSANANAKYIYNAVNNYSQKCINYGAKIPSGTYPATGWLTITKPDTPLNSPEVPGHMFEGASNTVAIAQGFVESAVNLSSAAEEYGSVYRVEINQYGGVSAVVWAKSENDIYVGGYPTLAERTGWTLTQAAK